MSKLDVELESVKIAEVENKLVSINDYFVLVENKYIEQLNQANIVYSTFTNNKLYIVRQGKKKKKFNAEQVQAIKNDLEELSIRKCADKYKCSTRTIQNIKNDKY